MPNRWTLSRCIFCIAIFRGSHLAMLANMCVMNFAKDFALRFYEQEFVIEYYCDEVLLLRMLGNESHMNEPTGTRYTQRQYWCRVFHVDMLTRSIDVFHSICRMFFSVFRRPFRITNVSHIRSFLLPIYRLRLTGFLLWTIYSARLIVFRQITN